MPLNQPSQNDTRCDRFIYNRNIFPALELVMFPIALLLNGVAAWVSLHLRSTSTFVVYLKNLVAADLTMTLIMPLKVSRNLQGTSQAAFVLSCYFSSIFYSTKYTCITLLGFISVDRFFKIMAPKLSGHSLFGNSVTFSKLLSGSAWVILLGGTALPNIIFNNNAVTNITASSTCMKLKGPVGLDIHHAIVIYLNVYFWLVSVVIVVCYICISNKVIQSFRNSGSSNQQGKQRIKLRVFLVVIVFFALFTPYHIIRIPYTFHQVTSPSKADCSYLISRFAKELSLWLSNTNICMDPLLYVFLCREFREKLVSMVEKVSIRFKVAPAAAAKPQSAF